jgi:hypothetical protein
MRCSEAAGGCRPWWLGVPLGLLNHSPTVRQYVRVRGPQVIRISRSRSFLPPLPFPVPAFPPAVSGQRGASQEAPGDWRPVKTAPAAPSPARTPAAGQRRPASPPRRARPPPRCAAFLNVVLHRRHAAPALPRRRYASVACRIAATPRPPSHAPASHVTARSGQRRAILCVEVPLTHGPPSSHPVSTRRRGTHTAMRLAAMQHTHAHIHTRARVLARVLTFPGAHTHTLTHTFSHTHALSHTHTVCANGDAQWLWLSASIPVGTQ